MDSDTSSLLQMVQFVGDSPGVLKEVNKELTAQLAAARAQLRDAQVERDSQSALTTELSSLKNQVEDLRQGKADLELQLKNEGTLLDQVQSAGAANKHLSDELEYLHGQLRRERTLRVQEQAQEPVDAPGTVGTKRKTPPSVDVDFFPGATEPPHKRQQRRTVETAEASQTTSRRSMHVEDFVPLGPSVSPAPPPTPTSHGGPTSESLFTAPPPGTQPLGRPPQAHRDSDTPIPETPSVDEFIQEMLRSMLNFDYETGGVGNAAAATHLAARSAEYRTREPRRRMRVEDLVPVGPSVPTAPRPTQTSLGCLPPRSLSLGEDLAAHDWGVINPRLVVHIFNSLYDKLENERTAIRDAQAATTAAEKYYVQSTKWLSSRASGSVETRTPALSFTLPSTTGDRI